MKITDDSKRRVYDDVDEYYKHQGIRTNGLIKSFGAGVSIALNDRIVADMINTHAIDKNINILCAGSRDGSDRVAIHLRGFPHIWAVDINPMNTLVEKGDFHDLRFPDTSFNLVVCKNSIEHTPTPSIALKEFHRVLSDNGILLIVYPVEDKELTMNDDDFHACIFTREEFLKLVEDAGFRVMDDGVFMTVLNGHYAWCIKVKDDDKVSVVEDGVSC